MRCPVCKADNAQGPLCRRCKADLSLLWRLEAQRGHLLAEALHCLTVGRSSDAVQIALRADALRADGESRRLVAITSLFSRNFELALQYQAGVDRASDLAER
jgi:hypothetical protein